MKGTKLKYFVKTHFYQSITYLEKGDPDSAGYSLGRLKPKASECIGGIRPIFSTVVILSV